MMTIFLNYQGNVLNIIALNGAFWFSADDLAPCLGLSPGEIEDCHKNAPRLFSADRSRLFEVLHPDGTLKLTRIFTLEGVRLLTEKNSVKSECLTEN